MDIEQLEKKIKFLEAQCDSWKGEMLSLHRTNFIGSIPEDSHYKLLITGLVQTIEDTITLSHEVTNQEQHLEELNSSFAAADMAVEDLKTYFSLLEN